MTDLETSAPVEGGGVPTSPSQPQAATSSQATPTIESLQKQIDELKGQLRGTQSEKDKGIYKLEKKVDEAIARYEEYRKEMTPAKARRELQLDALLERESEGEPVRASSQPAQGSAPAGPTKVEVEAVLKAFGLDASDPQVLDVMRNTTDLPSATVAFASLASQRKLAPNPAAIQSVGGGSAVLAEDDLQAVEKKLAALKAQPSYMMDAKEYKRLVQKYNQLVQLQTK